MHFPIWCPTFEKLLDYAHNGYTACWMNEGTTPANIPYDQYFDRCKQVGLQVWSYPQQFCTNPGTQRRSPDRYSLKDETTLHKMAPSDINAQISQFLAVEKKPLVLNLQGDKFARFLPKATDKEDVKMAWLAINQQQGPFFKSLADHDDSLVFFDFYLKNRPRYTLDPKTGKPILTQFTWYDYTNLFACIDFGLQYHKQIG